jgi:hypothetical protein
MGGKDSVGCLKRVCRLRGIGWSEGLADVVRARRRYGTHNRRKMRILVSASVSRWWCRQILLRRRVGT